MVNFHDFLIQRRFSRLTSVTPNLYKYPLYYDSFKSEFVINEGEGLFIPYGWYHYVISEDVNINTSLNIAISHFMTSPQNESELNTNLYYYINNKKKYDLIYDFNKNNIDIDNIINLHKKDSIPFKLLNMPNINITIDDLKNTFNDDEIIINSSVNNFFSSNYIKEYTPNNCQENYMNFNNFLDTNKKTSQYNYYLIQESEEYLKKIKDIKIPYFINNLKNRNLWINFGKVYTVLHYDCYDNFIWQVQGTKRIILFPPSERNKLYMYNPYPLDFLYNIKHDSRYYNVLKF
jgi:hypothetical protein